MLVLLTIHAVAALVAPLLVRWFGRYAFIPLAAVPAVSFAWLVSKWNYVGSGGEVRESFEWLPALDMDLAFRLDSLALLVILLVTGIGTLIFAYCAHYFSTGEAGLGRFAAVLTGFAGAMFGLVLSDNLLLLYVFWELTTVFSYLLIGHTSDSKTSRRSAMQALMVTTFGGLAMLVGVIMLGEAANSYLLSDILAQPPTGAYASVAVVLLLLGALSKSAIFPFQFWLPAAMAAPTPVSAYLHAAAMVKAGIFLVARLAPGFADAGTWRPMIITLGLLTMVLGAYRAMRQYDLKLLLAYGTVSQLGFLMILTGAGTREAAIAGIAMLVAHALFKATLFLVVGAIDHSTGTRDLRELNGFGRKVPALAVAGTIAALSMAGVPPLAGFVGKEAAYEAFLHSGLPSGVASGFTLVIVVAASMLTFAYSARFVWGAFLTKNSGAKATPVHHHPEFLLTSVPLVLAASCIVFGIGTAMLDSVTHQYVSSVPGDEKVPHLALWHGFGPALYLSAATIAVGVALYLLRERVERWQGIVAGPGDAAELAYRRLMGWIDRFAIEVTAIVQRGSLNSYLATILATLIAFMAAVLIFSTAWPSQWHLWDTPLQAIVGAIAICAAIAATRISQRIAAVLLVGVTGYCTGLFFAFQGAPDLALTQFLVETLTLVVFVLVLRKLPKNITERHGRRERVKRLLIAVPAGVVITLAGAVAVGSRIAEPISSQFAERAYEFGGGKNIVNVILVDIRAWDTMGEISVLTVAATGVASMVYLRRRSATQEDVSSALPSAVGERQRWLTNAEHVQPQRRSLVLQVVTRLVFHTVLVFSLYLLFAGHNVPGGGFAGGLVAGMAFVVRYLAGGRFELREAAPVDPGRLLGAGLLISSCTAIAGLFFGGQVLQTAIIEYTLPVYGDVKVVSAFLFDLGVYLIVIGLVLDVLRTLGAELDRREEVAQ